MKTPEAMSQPVVVPADQHNRELVDQVHPPDWVNPTPAGRYNLVVIGAGTAGLVTAAGAAGLGAKVALVERHLMGGDCLNYGCVPSKALIRAARAAVAVRDAGRFGVEAPGAARVDFAAVMERMRRLRAGISHHDSAARFRELGVDVYLGPARFSGRDTVRVGQHSLRYARAVIATGGRAAAPDVAGLAEAGYLTNETLFSLTALPPRLAVIGGGPIGCEMAQSFARFGAQVFLIQRSSQILTREDRDAALLVQQALARDGVELVFDAGLQRVARRDRDKLLIYQRQGQLHELAVDEILVAAGRAPNVEELGLDEAGVAFDERQGVHVDDRLRTSNRRIFAAGDVCSRYKFTHIADFQARIVIQNALFHGRARASRLVVPWCTYTDPELAHVGLHPAEAAERGWALDTFLQPLEDVDRALLDGEQDGFVKIHVRRGSDRIVGATIVAAHAGELISEITLAMAAGAGLKTVGRTIHPYPTQAEAIRKLGDAYNRTRLTPRIKWLFEKWLAWSR